MRSLGKKRYALLRLGAWVSAEALLNNRISNFIQGLEQLHSLAENTPIYLILPNTKSDYAAQVKNIAGRNSWIKLLEVPSKYPFDNFKLLARLLALDKGTDNSPLWCVGTEGVLAIDQALTSSKLCNSRIISIGGPGARTAGHVKAITGYPLTTMLQSYREASPTRVINGGVLTGSALADEQKGLDVECQGLTLVPENNKRELLAFPFGL